MHMHIPGDPYEPPRRPILCCRWGNTTGVGLDVVSYRRSHAGADRFRTMPACAFVRPHVHHGSPAFHRLAPGLVRELENKGVNYSDINDGNPKKNQKENVEVASKPHIATGSRKSRPYGPKTLYEETGSCRKIDLE